MAFYNGKMARNKAIRKAWKAGHWNTIHCDEEISLPEICSEIGNWMRRDRRPRSRLSLRSFSVLLSGAMRIYRDQLNNLLKDTFNCSIHPISRTPVLAMADQAIPNIERSEKPPNGNQSKSTEYDTDTESLPADDLFDTTSDDESTVFTVTPNDIGKTNTDNRKPAKTRDQIIQTSPTPEASTFSGFDPNLPFGYILVHDNYYSRIPSKILFSSLTDDAKFLPIRRPVN